MGFFDGVVGFSGFPIEPEQQVSLPARFGPPEGWVLPTVLPWVRVLGQSSNARIAMVGLRCWPHSVSIDVHLMVRRGPRVDRGTGRPARQEWALRFGTQFSDGRRIVATDFPPRIKNNGHPNGAKPHAEPADVVLRAASGGGGRFHRKLEFHLWPVPPKGRLTLVVDWPAEGIPETRTELDAGEIRSAAARAVVIWPDLPTWAADADQSGAVFG
jgi:hypothetical protein